MVWFRVERMKVGPGNRKVPASAAMPGFRVYWVAVKELKLSYHNGYI